MSSFHITLPSDSSATFFPNNTVAHFTTKLPDCIALDGEYEVGLTEIIYPQNFPNFYSPNPLKIDIWFKIDEDDDDEEDKFIGTWLLENRNFENQQKLAEYMSKALTQYVNKLLTSKAHAYFSNRVIPQFKIQFQIPDESIHKEFFKIEKCPYSNSGISCDLDSVFMNRFGLKYDQGTDRYTFAKNFNMLDGVIESTRLMYVYCDIASHNYVGDIKTPLLRVFNTDGKDTKMAIKTFLQPIYLPVSKREFETIEINLNNELGKPIPFIDGKSVVTLHFRRVNKYL